MLRRWIIKYPSHSAYIYMYVEAERYKDLKTVYEIDQVVRRNEESDITIQVFTNGQDLFYKDC